MAFTTTTSLSQEFVSKLSAQMIYAPSAEHVFALMARAAIQRAGLESLDTEIAAYYSDLPGFVGPAGAIGMAADQSLATGMYDPLTGSLQLSADGLQMATEMITAVVEVTQPGKTILINKPTLLAGSATEANARATEGTAVSTTGQTITTGQVTLTVREHHGPYSDSTSKVEPVSVTEFLVKRAEHSVIARVGGELRRSYWRYVDRTTIDLCLTSTNTTICSGQFGAAAGGTTQATMVASGNYLTAYDLDLIAESLAGRYVPRFSTGKWCLCLLPKGVTMLKRNNEFREAVRYQPVSLNPLIRGYVGDFGAFHIVESNTIPTTTGGAGDAVTVYQGIACGPGCVGWGVSMPAQVRVLSNTDGGRQFQFYWLSHDTSALLNADLVQVVMAS